MKFIGREEEIRAIENALKRKAITAASSTAKGVWERRSLLSTAS